MQLAGSRFTEATAEHGNDFATLPSFPAEIRAPAGTLAGVSAFQIHFAAQDILTPGDEPDVLVAMNPAALRSELPALARGGTVIANEDAFSKRNLQKAGYDSNPLEDGSLDGHHLIRIPMTALTTSAVEAMEGVSTRDAGRAKNLFALGVVSWLYDRPTEPTEDWLRRKFVNKPGPLEANLAAFRAGWNFGETSELIRVQYKVDPATDVPPGTYRNLNGTTATALGLIAASVRAGLPLVLASYPITPASELLPELARHQDMGVRTIQAEDEIAAAGMALGAAFGGALGVTATSGPGLDLKTETIGLAVALELPMVIVDVQRAGPSTGMPTKTEQSDLLAALSDRPASRQSPGVPTCWRPPRAATASRPSRSSPPRRRGSASTPPTRRCASPCATARRSSCSRTSSWPTARSRGGSRRRPRCPPSIPASRSSPATATPSCPTRATTTARARGRSPARPVWRTASAAWRSRTSPARSATTPPTTRA